MTISLPLDSSHLWYLGISAYAIFCIVKHAFDLRRIKKYNGGADLYCGIHPARTIPLLFYNLTLCLPLYLLIVLCIEPTLSVIYSILTFGFRRVRSGMKFMVVPAWYDEWIFGERFSEFIEY